MTRERNQQRGSVGSEGSAELLSLRQVYYRQSPGAWQRAHLHRRLWGRLCTDIPDPTDPEIHISARESSRRKVTCEQGSEGSAESYAVLMEDQRDQRSDPDCFQEAAGEIMENNKTQRVDRAENPSAELSVEGVLQVREDPNTGAYKNALLYSAGETSLEYLVRSVLFAKGIPTETWQSYAGLVEEAFEEWRSRGL